jgi:signal transduction histidine kinase
MDVTSATSPGVKRRLASIGHIDIAGAFAVSLIVFAGHWLFLLTAEPASTLRGVVDSAFLPIEGLLAALLLWLASRSDKDAFMRRSLWILGLAQFIYAVGDASLALTEALTGDYRYSLFAHALFVTYYALTVFALLQLSLRSIFGNSLRLALDMAIVIIASTMVFASLVLTPYVSVARDDPTELITLLIYPALDLLALWLVFALLLRQIRLGLSLVLYSLALCVVTLADFCFVYQTSRDLYVSGGSIVDFLFPLHLVLVGAAAYAQSVITLRSSGGLTMSRDELAPMLGNRPMSRWVDLGRSLVPYVWVAIAYAVMVMEQRGEPYSMGVETFMTVGFSVVLGLVIARQTLMMRDNSALAYRQRRLIDASLLLAGPMDLKRASERILREARKLVRSDETYIALFQEGDSELIIGGHIGAISGMRHAIPLQSRGTYRALRDLKSVETISNADGMTMQPEQYASAFALLHDCRGALWLATSLRQLESVVIVPLVSNDQTLGALLLCAHSRNNALSDQQDLLASFGRQAAASVENARLRQSQVQAATSEERSRLSRELHDSVLQSLFGVALGMRTARAHLDGGNKGAIDAIDYSSRLMENAQAEMRALILELRPEGLINGGLIVTLNRQARLLCDRSKVGLYVDFDVVEPNLPIETKEALYRVILEAINNVIRHANATQLHLRMTRDEGRLLLTVADNGVGFDKSQRPEGHIGIESMRERCAAIGASLEFHTAPGTGTIVRVSLDSGT